jgi:hypothetical protein
VPSSSPPRRSRRVTFMAVALAALAIIVGIVGVHHNDAKPKPSGLTFKTAGQCTSNSGRVFGIASGLTPGGKYVTEMWDPDGQPYTNLPNPGTSDEHGGTPNWYFTCYAGKAPGKYKVRIADLTTGKSSAAYTFEVLRPVTR